MKMNFLIIYLTILEFVSKINIYIRKKEAEYGK